MKYTIEISDDHCKGGIGPAREAHNAGLTPEREANDAGEMVAKAIDTHPDYIATDEAYVQYVMCRAAESYAKTYASCPTCGAKKA